MGTLETDEMMFQEDPESRKTYNQRLSKIQQKAYQPVRDFMQKQFDITIQVQTGLMHFEPHPSLQKLTQLIKAIDPYTLASLYVISSTLKSTSLALYFLMNQCDPKECLNISRTGENFQIENHGRVEGAHDYDEMRSLSDITAAKVFLSLI